MELLFQENSLFGEKTGLFQKLESLLKTKRAKIIFSDNRENNLMKQFKFYSTQVKQILISGVINFAYKLPHEFSNDLRLIILEN